jgi:hypothetical protein
MRYFLRGLLYGLALGGSFFGTLAVLDWMDHPTHEHTAACSWILQNCRTA